MSSRTRIGLVVAVWSASLFGAGMWGHAQAPLQTPANPAPLVLSGSDIGFRVVSQKGGTPVGTLVVRMNGQWVEVEQSVAVKRLTATR